MAALHFLVDGFTCSPAENLYDARTQRSFALGYWEKVNSVYLYRGRRPSEAHLLIPKTFIDTITGSSTSGNTITITDGTSSLTMPGWRLWLCEATEAYINADQLYYCQFRDPRSIGEITYVKDSYAILEDTHDFVTTSTMTWQQVLDALWGLLPGAAKGASGSCPTLAVTPSSKAEFLDFDGISVWRAICQALAACGHVPVYNPINQVYSFLEYGGTQAGLDGLRTSWQPALIWKGSVPYTKEPTYPEKVAVVFPPYLHTKPSRASYVQPYTVEVSTGMTGAVPGTKTAIVDTSLAIRTKDDIDNTGQLSARATDLARTVKGVCAAAAGRGVEAYEGVISSFLPGEQLTAVVWAEHPRKSVYTQIETTGEIEFDLPTPVKRAYSFVEVLKVTGAKSGSYFPATMQRWNVDTLAWVDQYTCKALEVNDGDLTTDQRYFGTFEGYATNPIFAVQLGGGGGKIIEFDIISVETEVSSSSPYYGLKKASVTIKRAPCDGAALLETVVDVYDHSLCVFDIPNAELVGVRGWASEGIAQSLAAGAPANTPTPCHWCADDRCCTVSEGGGVSGGTTSFSLMAGLGS